MDLIVGIDLGTTNSLIGAMESGFPLLLADGEGRRLTPSVVHFPEKDEPLVGWPALRMRAIAPGRTIYSIKRFMGRRGEEISAEEAEVDYSLVRPKGKPVAVEVAGKRYRPEEISALILAKLKGDAESALGCEVRRAVVTVPAYFQ